MSLEIIVGPMFAGKSSYLLSTIRRYTAIGWSVLTITSDIDTRYATNAICSHNQEKYPARAVKLLMPLLQDTQYESANLIIIEESQFFDDLIEFVLHSVEHKNKFVVVVGLDGDSERRPFGKILELIPYCDKVTKVTSLCKLCGNGTPALFTHRKSPTTDVINVGAAEQYEALCRKHYLEQKNIVPVNTEHMPLHLGC